MQSKHFDGEFLKRAVRHWLFAFCMGIVSEAIVKLASFIALLQVAMQVYITEVSLLNQYSFLMKLLWTVLAIDTYINIFVIDHHPITTDHVQRPVQRPLWSF